MTSTSIRFGLCALLAAALPLSGCDDAASTVVAVNSCLPASVYEVWWNTTLIDDPIAPCGRSAAQRTVPASDVAYALIAPGWSPEAGGRPPALIAVESAAKLSVARGAELEIVVSDDTFVGDCAAGKPLDADSARFIVERIFPGAFAGATYDPATCVTTPLSADAGTDQDQ